jgi:hypothetical protein
MSIESRIHPLEEVFDMTAGEYFENKQEYDEVLQSELPSTIINTSKLAVQQEIIKDEEDTNIDNNIDNIYNKALAAFNQQTEMVEVVDPRYAARTAEVAANYLNIALNAMAIKSKVKNDRYRRSSSGFIPYTNGPKTVNNNLIVADRNDILKMMKQDKDKEE